MMWRFLLGITAVGCGGVERTPPRAPRPNDGIWLPSITLTTPNTSIAAGDGSWKLESGGVVPMPPSLANQPGPTCSLSTRLTSADYGVWRANGAIDVRIAVPGVDEPFYGIYALCAVTPQAFPISAYELQFPDERIEEAKKGMITIIFQESATVQHTYSWVIWLSRAPFPATPRS